MPLFYYIFVKYIVLFYKIQNYYYFTEFVKQTKNKTMNAVNIAKSRIKKYPELVLTCHIEAFEYASCVIQHENDLKPNSCKTQFIKFKKCLTNNAKKCNLKI